jgi:hypothetical protein
MDSAQRYQSHLSGNQRGLSARAFLSPCGARTVCVRPGKPCPPTPACSSLRVVGADPCCVPSPVLAVCSVPKIVELPVESAAPCMLEVRGQRPCRKPAKDGPRIQRFSTRDAPVHWSSARCAPGARISQMGPQYCHSSQYRRCPWSTTLDSPVAAATVRPSTSLRVQ